MHTSGPWIARSDEVGIISQDYDQSYGMFIPIAEIFGENKETDARLMASAPDLLAALKELHALVWGECPSLLNEDSGGSARLDMEIRNAIVKAEGKE
jgi:hypothetical protein